MTPILKIIKFTDKNIDYIMEIHFVMLKFYDSLLTFNKFEILKQIFITAFI